MNLKQLEAVVWVARLGGFAAAAGKLNTTQPAISARVRELEKELDVELFDRTHHQVHLTPKGRECLEIAERLLLQAAELQQRVGAKSGLSGRVRLGVTESIALTWLPDFLSRLNTEHPLLMTDLEVDLSLGLLARLNRGLLDVIMLGGEVDRSAFESEYLGQVEMVWLVKPGYADASLVLSPKELASYRILTLSKYAAIYNIVQSWFAAGDAYPHECVFCNSMTSLAFLTMAGLGVSLLPRELFASEIAEDKLCVLGVSPPIPAVKFHAIYPRDRGQPVGQHIATLAREVSTFLP